jgi:hypothetical protein
LDDEATVENRVKVRDDGSREYRAEVSRDIIDILALAQSLKLLGKLAGLGMEITWENGMFLPSADRDLIVLKFQSALG